MLGGVGAEEGDLPGPRLGITARATVQSEQPVEQP